MVVIAANYATPGVHQYTNMTILDNIIGLTDTAGQGKEWDTSEEVTSFAPFWRTRGLQTALISMDGLLQLPYLATHHTFNVPQHTFFLSEVINRLGLQKRMRKQALCTIVQSTCLYRSSPCAFAQKREIKRARSEARRRRLRRPDMHVVWLYVNASLPRVDHACLSPANSR